MTVADLLNYEDESQDHYLSLAVHSTPSDIAMHIAETIRQFIFADGTHLPDPDYPRYFSIEINRSIARLPDINLPDSTELKKHLELLEDK